MNEKQSPWLAIAALVVLSLIWGYNWVVMKQVLRFVDPFDFSAFRAVFGAVSLFLLLFLLRRPFRPQALRATILLGVLQCTVFIALIQWALVGGGAGKTSVLVYVMPFWLLPLAWVFLGERIRGLQWVAVVLAAAGLAFIIEPWEGEQGGLFSTALALLAGIIWAVSAIIAKRARRDAPVDMLTFAAWQMLIGAVLLSALAALLPSRPIEPTWYFVGALAYNAIFATALAWLLWLFILERLTAGVAGLSSLAVPAVGVLSAWLELGEQPSAAEGLGMLLIAGALGLICTLAILRSHHPPREGTTK